MLWREGEDQAFRLRFRGLLINSAKLLAGRSVQLETAPETHPRQTSFVESTLSLQNGERLDARRCSNRDGGNAEGGGASEVVSFGPGRLAGSPLFVPRGEAEDDGYILTFVYDAARHESDLVVLDAKDLAGEPVATVALGQHVPPLFHGIWTKDVCLHDR